MSQQLNTGSLSVGEFVRQIRSQLIPLGTRFSYFFTAITPSADDIREYLEEPIQALPPVLRAKLPNTAIILAPYLMKGRPADGSAQPLEDLITFERPETKNRVWESMLVTEEGAVLVFAIKEQDVAEYHYHLYHCLALLAAESTGDETHDPYFAIIRDELSADVHGEVDEDSWELKQALLRRQRNMRRKTKGFARYARQSLIDTLTLYLHGICCDIDVDTGPRQLASRHLRRRLELLQGQFPPPEGFAVFPEDLREIEAGESGACAAAPEGNQKPVASDS